MRSSGNGFQPEVLAWRRSAGSCSDTHPLKRANQIWCSLLSAHVTMSVPSTVAHSTHTRLSPLLQAVFTPMMSGLQLHGQQTSKASTSFLMPFATTSCMPRS